MLTRSIFTALLLAWPSLALANENQLEFPAFYNVVGVAADDTLNMREGPGTAHPVLEEIAHNARDLEVVGASDDGRWALLNTADWSGWTSFRFLERQAGFDDPSELPLPINCGGTEPFWHFAIAADGSAEYSDPSLHGTSPDPLPLTLNWSGPAAARAGLELGAYLSGDLGEVNAVMVREICYDGMSDFS